MTFHQPRTALILGGGGARAAYQVGVLKAVSELLPDPAHNPFPILCGTSAGSINAAVLAVRARNFAAGVDYLGDFWSNIHAGDVYCTDALSIAAVAARWLLRRKPRALLDNAPLRRLLERAVDFEQLEPAVAAHALLALSVTCSGYASGQSVSFFQGRADLDPWSSGQRVGAHVILGINHLMASNATPFLFPAVRMNREYFGDGAMRQLSPISPAIRLGAEKLMVIGEGRMSDEGEEREPGEEYPSPAQIAGHVLSGALLDPLTVDLERVQCTSQTLRLVPEASRAAATPLRPIEVLVIAPSQRLDHLAAEHMEALPQPVRTLLRRIGAMSRAGSALTSCLLFEPPYTRTLIELGYRDTLARSEDVRHFLDVT